MNEKYFISIPIYRFSKEDYDKKVQEIRKRSFYVEHLKMTFYDAFFFYSYAFNEVVGWLRLYFYYSSLQVELWLFEHKRKNWAIKLKKKNFSYRGRLTELPIIIANLSSEEITNEVVKAILSAQESSKDIRDYFVDLDEFKQIGPALDWQKIKISSNHVQAGNIK